MQYLSIIYNLNPDLIPLENYLFTKLLELIRSHTSLFTEKKR